MASLAKKYDTAAAKRDFPPEAYDYTDDVTPAAVEILREMAREEVESEEWEVIDGFREFVAA